jgi:hypothetical protein
VKARRLPEIPASALRDYGSNASVGRVFQRLEANLVGQRPLAPRRSLVSAAAGAIAIFGMGVFVGARFFQAPASPHVSAERWVPPVDRPAGGHAQGSLEPEPVASSNAPARLREGHRAPSREARVEAFLPSEPLPLASPAGPPEWQRLADVGDFLTARRAIDAVGGFDTAIEAASPGQLMTLVDIARASGERQVAVLCLRQVLVHSEAAEAPLAAWTLGNLLDQSSDPAGAAEAFALYRRLSPHGDFAEDATVRQIDVALARGNVDLVTELVEDYAHNFPRGRRLGEFRKALAALTLSHEADAGAKADLEHEEPEEELDESQSTLPGAAAPTTGTESH